MKTSTGKPTKAEAKRFGQMAQLGCVCCRIMGDPEIASEVHHITKAGRRISHSATLSLCAFHHRAVQENFWTHVPYSEMVESKGPSLAKGKQTFVDHWGTEEELLDFQDKLLAEMFDES